MSEGKIDGEFFESHVRPRLGADGDSVVVGPAYGVDFGAIDVGDDQLVVSTDPLAVFPSLGLERAGRLTLHSTLADVAVSGVPPSALAVCLTLPESTTGEEFERLWRGIHEECVKLGVSVVTGHTGRQSGAAFPWVGGAMAMGVAGDREIVRPDGAQPGDRILLTDGPGIEVTGLFATLFPDAFDLSDELLAQAQDRLERTTVVRDAVTAADAGAVTAIHDATECGLQGALVEMASAGGVRFDVNREAVPEPADVSGVCDAVDLDPWQVSSRGTLLVTVRPDDARAVIAALEDCETPVYDIGTVGEGQGVFVDETRTSHPGTDRAWEVFGALQERGASGSDGRDEQGGRDA